jgi:riboflavin synthase|tara:strand:- start:189 stop:767 length:579 start_codon:yes stop_codon:yes gene_type:complete
MFNGIIYNQAVIKNIKKFKKSFYIEVVSNIKFSKKDTGRSISCNGVCLTISNVIGKSIFFYLSPETMNVTNFNYIKIGDFINIERSIKYGDDISGHFVQGHVDTTGIVKKVSIISKTWFVDIQISKKYINFLTKKGSVSINGVSLTVSKINRYGFQITIIPHTLKLTNLKMLSKNKIINIEFDMIGKYLKKI